MHGKIPTAALALLALAASACAREGSEAVGTELRRLDASAAHGVAKIERALRDPRLESSELGEGVHLVEVATRELAILENDERASDVQQLMAVVHQARAWDDVASTFAATTPPPGLDAAQGAVLLSILDEKAYPARAAARAGYERAIERACRSGLEHIPIFQELLDGASRYGSTRIPLDRPCAEP